MAFQVRVAALLTGCISSLQSTTFLVIDRVVALIVSLQQASTLSPSVSINERHTMFKLISTVRACRLRHDLSVAHTSPSLFSCSDICVQITQHTMPVLSVSYGLSRTVLGGNMWSL